MRDKNLKPYDLGKAGEEVALKYLKRKKFKIIKKGFRLYKGEIDVIAYDRKTLVFIEVKTRRSRSFGLPEESVTTAKQRQIKKIAQGFMAFNNLENVECRFDVISLIFNKRNGYFIRHFKDAF